MAIKTVTQSFVTNKGVVEGVRLEWDTFSLLLVSAPRGFLVCGIFDLEAINLYGRAAAIVEGSPDNPIGTLDRFMERKITALNAQAQEMGVCVGMSVRSALEAMF